MNLVNCHGLKCCGGRGVINRNHQVCNFVKREIRWSDFEPECIVISFWLQPFEDEVDIQNEIAAAPVVPFDDVKPMNGIVVPTIVLELLR